MGARLYGAAHAAHRLVMVDGAGHEDAMPKAVNHRNARSRNSRAGARA